MADTVEVILKLRDDASKSLGKVADESERAAGKADGLRKVLDGLGFGGLRNDADDLTEGLGKLGISSSTATAALGGLAAGMVSLAATKAMLSFLLEIDKAMLDWTLHVSDLAAELEDLNGMPGFGQPIPDDVVDSVAALGAEGEALNDIWTAVKVTVGVELAPVLADLGRWMVAGALAAKDLYDGFLSIRRAAIDMVSAILPVGAAVEALTGPAAGYLARADQLIGAGSFQEFGPFQDAPAAPPRSTPRTSSRRAAKPEAPGFTPGVMDLGWAESMSVTISMDDLAEATDELHTAVAESNRLAEAEARRAAALAAASGGLDAAGRIAGGNIGGALALAGPVGAVVGQAVDAVAMLGREGAKGIADNIRNAVRDILRGVRELPKLLTEELPSLITDLIPAIATALIEAGPDLVMMQYEASFKIAMAIIQTVFVRLPSLIAESVTKAILNAWNAIKEFFKDPVGGLLGGDDGKIDWRKLATNAVRGVAAVATLGLSEMGVAAYRGADRALEANGGRGLPGYSASRRNARSTAPSSAARTMSGASADLMGGTHVHFHGPVMGGSEGVKQLVREINKHAGSRGTGLTLSTG